MIDDVCMYLVSKPADDWTDLREITEVVREFGLTDAEAEFALVFLTKYFLELDERGERARLIRSFYDVYRRE